MNNESNLNPNWQPQPAPDFLVETIDGELVILQPATGKIVQANPTAALVWQLCNGQRTTAEITALLQAAYPDSASQIAADVPELLHELQTLGLLLSQ